MNLGVKDLLKKIRFEYIRQNKALVETLYYCYGFSSLTYEEIAGYLGGKGENTAGLLIRLERGIELGLIVHDRVSSLKERKYYLEEEGKICIEVSLLEIKEEIRNKKKKINEKTSYIV